jgi:hypothetical protein
MLSYYLLQKTVIYQQEAILNISNKTVLTSIHFARNPILIGSWDSPGGVMTRQYTGCLKNLGLFPRRSSYFMLTHPNHLGPGT